MSFSVRHEEDTHLRENSLTTHLLIPQFSTRGRKHTRKTVHNWSRSISFSRIARLLARGREMPRSCRSESAATLIMNSAETGSQWDCLHAALLFLRKITRRIAKVREHLLLLDWLDRQKTNFTSQLFTLFINVNMKALFNHNHCLAPSDALYLSSHKCWFTKKTTSNSRMYRYNLKPMNPFSS